MFTSSYTIFRPEASSCWVPVLNKWLSGHTYCISSVVLYLCNNVQDVSTNICTYTVYFLAVLQVMWTFASFSSGGRVGGDSCFRNQECSLGSSSVRVILCEHIMMSQGPELLLRTAAHQWCGNERKMVSWGVHKDNRNQNAYATMTIAEANQIRIKIHLEFDV